MPSYKAFEPLEPYRQTIDTKVYPHLPETSYSTNFHDYILRLPESVEIIRWAQKIDGAGTLYTVPTGFRFFLFGYTMCIWNNHASYGYGLIRKNDTAATGALNYVDSVLLGETKAITQSYYMPIELKEGEVLQVLSSKATLQTSATIYGIAVPEKYL